MVVITAASLGHRIMVRPRSDNTVGQMMGWCLQHVGPRVNPFNPPSQKTWRNGNWQIYWVGHGNTTEHYEFAFQREQDAVVFSLKWS
jgi:hypothetical protein